MTMVMLKKHNALLIVYVYANWAHDFGNVFYKIE